MQNEMPSKEQMEIFPTLDYPGDWGTLRSEDCGFEIFQTGELMHIPLPQNEYFKHGERMQQMMVLVDLS